MDTNGRVGLKNEASLQSASYKDSSAPRGNHFPQNANANGNSLLRIASGSRLMLLNTYSPDGRPDPTAQINVERPSWANGNGEQPRHDYVFIDLTRRSMVRVIQCVGGRLFSLATGELFVNSI